MDKIIPLRINQRLIADLDALVNKGYYPNRNEGLRSSLRGLLHQYQKKPPKSHTLVAQIIANYLKNEYSNLIKAVVLFGSVAMETHTEESDIDLLILTYKKVPYKEEMEIITHVQHLLENILAVPSLHFQEWSNFQYAINHNFTFETQIQQKGKILQGTYE